MADPVGAAASIIGIASFGLKFAITLQTYIETVVDARESWQEIAFDVSATASALEQLHEFTKPSENGKAIVNESGFEQVTRLALQCRQVYKAIIDLIAKAAGIPRDDNGDVSVDELDLDNLNTGSLMQRLIWPFQERRVKKHREELRWLKISLLFHLRLMELAKTKMNPTRSLNAWEKEQALQATLERLLRRREAYARQIAAERRMSKAKGKRRRSLSRISSATTVEQFRPRSPSPWGLRSRRSSFGQRSPVPKSPKPGDRELSFSPLEDNNDNGVIGASTSRVPVDDVLTYMPNNSKPKPPKINTNPSSNQMMAFFADNQPEPVVEPSFARPVENHGVDDDKPENDNDSPVDESQVEGPSRGSMLLSPGSSASVSVAPPPAPAPINIMSTQTRPGNPNIINNPYLDQAPIPSNPPNQPATNDGEGNLQSPPDPTPAEHSIAKSKPKAQRRPRSILTLPRLSNLFRRRSRGSRLSWEGQELEAYLIEGDASDTIRKLPFNDEQLENVLRTIARSSSAGDAWTQYASLTSSQRASVDRAILEANRASAHARTFVTISLNESSSGESHIVVFFALGPPVPPVHLRYANRHYQFTYELCRTWEGMEELMKHALSDVEYLIQRRQYQLQSLSNHIILPETWSANVHPGLLVFLVITPGPPPPPPPSEPRRQSTEIRIPAPASVEDFRGFSSAKKSKKKKQKKMIASSDGLMAVKTEVRAAERAQDEEHAASALLSPHSSPIGRYHDVPYHYASDETGPAGQHTIVEVPPPPNAPPAEPPWYKGLRSRSRDTERERERERARAEDEALREHVRKLRIEVEREKELLERETALRERQPSPPRAVKMDVDRSEERLWEREGRVLESAAIPTRGLMSDSKSFVGDVNEDKEEEEEEDEGIDIIDFEEEQETAGLGLGSLLGKWTNAFDPAPDGNGEH